MVVRRTIHKAPLFDYPTDYVNSTGGKRHDETTCKNRYSFDEWRNLSCTWEYRKKWLRWLK